MVQLPFVVFYRLKIRLLVVPGSNFSAMKQSTTIPATLWVLLYASTSLLLVAHCTEFDGDFRPEQQGDDELKRSFLDLLGLKSPPLVNRTRAVRVPEYLEGVYKNDGTNTFTRQGDREARAIRATRGE